MHNHDQGRADETFPDGHIDFRIRPVSHQTPKVSSGRKGERSVAETHS